jgi:hypothetical protein
MRRLACHIGKEVFANQLADPDADGTSQQPCGRCPTAAKRVMHKLDNTIKAAALKAADQEGSA